MTKKTFTSMAELREQIALLRLERIRQEEALKERLSSPGGVLSAAISIFQPEPRKSLFWRLFNQDLLSNITRWLLPVALNQSIFRKSSFITRALVTLLSREAARSIDFALLGKAINKVRGFLQTRKDRGRKRFLKNYGIPDDSEAY